MPWWWVPNRTKQLSMAATLRVPCCAHAWRLGQTVEMCSVTIAFRWLCCFPVFRELIGFLTSPLLICPVLISSISGTSSAVITVLGLSVVVYWGSLQNVLSLMVLPPLSLIAVFLWVPSLHMVFVISYRVSMFPISAAYCASSIRLLRRGYTWKPYFGWVVCFLCKYLVDVSSNQESLCSFHISMFWVVL